MEGGTLSCQDNANNTEYEMDTHLVDQSTNMVSRKGRRVKSERISKQKQSTESTGSKGKRKQTDNQESRNFEDGFPSKGKPSKRRKTVEEQACDKKEELENINIPLNEIEGTKRRSRRKAKLTN